VVASDRPVAAGDRRVGRVPISHAIVLGLVQGLTEFLPISSSGHLLLVPWLFGWDDLESASVEKAFDVALHIGTLVAAVAYFRKDLVVYVRDGTRLVLSRSRPVTPEGRLAWLLVLSTVPAALVGALAEDFIDENLGTPAIIAVSSIVFGLLLGWADRSLGRRTVKEYGTGDAVVVGAAQALALNPGTSRSGITITAARRLGFDRDSAARLSFLMSIPVTFGAIVYKVGGLAADGIPDGLLAPMIVGIIAAGVSGWFAVWGTLRLVRTHSFLPFVIYRVALGVFVLLLLASGLR
jgi:undecaprenyl-diphosphatase